MSGFLVWSLGEVGSKTPFLLKCDLGREKLKVISNLKAVDNGIFGS